ncbi:winged helix-turn-helix transcriptional regulator [Halobaculum sp. D14]|uniref:winged helix-turn-helix transcriptional regulator n=1 Tax=Halobaculum sp. D14 TaxID=3421642 RepID=UPI003EB69B44
MTVGAAVKTAPRFDSRTSTGAADWRDSLTALHGTLSGKYALHVVRALADGPARFGDLREAVGDAPEKTLSRRLRELQCRDFIRRDLVPSSPPSAEYRLTDEGDRFVAPLRGLEAEVEYVDCTACDDDRRVATVDADATERALAEEC